MKHATAYHSGYHQNIDPTQTTATAPAIRTICKVDAATQRRRSNKKGQTAACTNPNAANGFVRCCFLPKLQTAQTLQDCRKAEKTERDFYKSLSQLVTHYNITIMDTRKYDYPYNITLALYDAEKKLCSTVRDWEGVKVVQAGRKTAIECTERFCTGSGLYYIPVLPLFRLLQNPEQKQAAGLLLSVFTYLYHIADVPYYRQENSFLFWQYDMLKDWILGDGDEDAPALLKEIEEAEQVGDSMETAISNRGNLIAFKSCIDSFCCKDEFDKDCLKLANEAFALYQQYPESSIFRNAGCKSETEEFDGEDVVTMDRYISFCADSKGWLSENIEQSVSAELQEYGHMEEPTIKKRF